MAARPLPTEDLDHVLRHTRTLWEEMRGQSVFITGGTGFFGMWLLESFVHANETLGLGARAVVLTRDPGRFEKMAPHLANRGDLILHAGDVRTFAFPPGHFDYVIHGAGDVTPIRDAVSALESMGLGFAGTQHVLAFAVQAEVKKFLLLSSGAVYGRQPSDLLDLSENYQGSPDPLLPTSAYGEGKRIAEFLCVQTAKINGFEVKIARCFTFVGPHLPLNGHYAIGNFIRDAMRGETIRVVGDGKPVRSYLYASDLAIWLWTILFRATSAFAYNVGSPVAISIEELAETVREIVGGGRTEKGALPVVGLSGSRYVPNVERAGKDLSLLLTIPLPEAIARTVTWYQ